MHSMVTLHLMTTQLILIMIIIIPVISLRAFAAAASNHLNIQSLHLSLNSLEHTLSYHLGWECKAGLPFEVLLNKK